MIICIALVYFTVVLRIGKDNELKYVLGIFKGDETT